MTPARFVTDSSLEFVARRLRFLGYDVASLRGARLEELFEAAEREGRILLSLSSRHPRRYGAVPALALRREDPEAAVREIATRFDPTGPPFSRCADCNAALQRRHPLEAQGEVPGRVLRSARALSFCPHCGKWYWDGSHVARLREWLERVLARSLAKPEPDLADPAS
jgi:uncharacterized protein with PIN domain